MSVSPQVSVRLPRSGDDDGSVGPSTVVAPPASEHVTGVSVRGSRFNNSASAYNNFSLSLFNLIVGPRDPSAPTGTQSEFPGSVYSRLLLPKACGFPLYDPQPPSWLNDEYRKEGVCIGDVGIVTTEGSFDFLFSIRHAADHPINTEGVPAGFVPPEWANDITPCPENCRDPGTYIMNGSVEALESEQPRVGYTFNGSAGEGAVLVLPTAALKAQVPNTRKFRDYAAENAFAWYRFAEELGRDASNGSIYLITGWEKTRIWGTASFQGNKNEFRFEYKNKEWTRYGSATTKRGPRDANVENQEFLNQCIFLSGFKVTLGESLWQRAIGAVEVSPVGNTAQMTLSRVSGGPSLGSLARWFHTSRQTPSDSSGRSKPGLDQRKLSTIVLEAIDPFTPQDVHPSNLINRFLLNKVPSAEVAITHDDVWCSLIKNVHAPFEEQILETYEITVQNGVVYLTERPSSPTMVRFGDVAAAGMYQSFDVVMEWQNIEPPSRFVGGSGDHVTVFPKIPDFDDINDLATQVQEATDILSRLLTGTVKWRKGEPIEHCRLVLESTVSQFVDFSKASTALLQTFSILSRRLCALLRSISDPECHSEIETFAKGVLSQMESVFVQISTVDRQHVSTYSQFEELMALVQDANSKDLKQDHQLFKRLDAFWKVVAAQLSDLLERRSVLPHPNICRDAKNRWEEYQGYLLGAMDALAQCSDALMVSADGLKVRERSISGYVKRGLFAFWSRLIQRTSTTGTKLTDRARGPMSGVEEHVGISAKPTLSKPQN